MFIKDSRHVWISSEKYSWEIILIRKCFDIFKMIFKNMWINTNFMRGFPFLSPTNDEKRPVPLRNIGLNCYLNSSFQSIVACNNFVEEMKVLEAKYPCSKNLHVFNKILYSLCENSSDDLELSSNSILRNWNRSGEQDTFELLSYIIFQVFSELRTLHQSYLPIEERTSQNWIKEQLPLKLLIEFRMKCDCGYAFTPTLQSDLALHLPVPFRIYSNSIPFTIERLLDNYFIPENISDFLCLNSDCTNSHVTKFIVLQKPMPNTLCLHIQRSFWNGVSNRMEKNNERVFFQDKLILKKEFFTENQHNRDGLLSSVCLDICKTENIFDWKMETEKDRGEIAGGDKIEINKSSDPSLETVSNGAPNDGIENSTSFDPIINAEIISPEINKSSAVEISSECCEIVQILSLPCNNEASSNCCTDIYGDGIKDCHSAGIDSYIDPGAIPAANALDQIESNSVTLSSIECEVYYLKSVIVHFGRAESGHYICYRKCGTKWFCTNDNFITEVSFNEVQKSQAYILMYERAH